MSTNDFHVLSSTEHYTTYELKSNQLKVTIVPCQSINNTIHSQVIYHVGSADERVGYTGSTHLLEHLMFKSSNNPRGEDIFTAMEPAGATINATTSFDRTNFYCTYGFQFFGIWCEAEATRMETAPFSERFDSKEKRVVQDELRIGNDNPYQKLRNHVMQTAFSRGPYEIDTGGFMRDVAEVTFRRLKKFHKSFYGPNNAHVVVCGRMRPAQILKHVAKHFKGISSAGRVPDRLERSEEPQHGARNVTVNVDSNVCMMMMSFRNMEGTHRDSIVSEVIASYLNHPSVGILSQLTEMGILPSTAVDNGRQKKRFLFSIVGALVADVPQLQLRVTQMIHEGLAKLKQQPVDAEVLRVVKKDLSNRWQGTMENVERLGSALTEAIAMGNLDDLWQRQRVLEGVTAEDLMRVSRYLFQNERMTFGLIRKRRAPEVLRPSQEAEGYEASRMSTALLSVPRPVSASDLELPSLLRDRKRPMKEQAPSAAPFGLFHRLALNSDRVKLLLTAKSSTANEALAKVAAKLIREGLPKVKLSHGAAPLSHYRREAHAAHADIADSFHTFMINNRLDFTVNAVQGKLQFQVAFDEKSDARMVLERLAQAIRSLEYISQESAEQIQMKSQMLIGQWMGATQDPRFLAEKEITERLFSSKDINRALNPEMLVEELKGITFKDIENFKNDLLSTEGKPLVASVAASPAIGDEQLLAAVEGFHRVLSPAFYESGGEDEFEQEELPFQTMPSQAVDFRGTEKYLVRQLDGRMEGLSAIGTRVDLSKNDPEYTALAVGLMCLGGGMNSLYNDVLRKEHGWTYGAYARMRGGNHDSASWVYSFASFDMQKMQKAVPTMREIYNKFCEDGITKEDFEVKRSNFELSMKVRMEQSSNLLAMAHQAVLNGCKTNFKDIMDRSQKVTLEEVNGAIRKHLRGKAFVHVLAGDFAKAGVEMV